MKTFWIRTASAVVYALLFLGTLLSGRLLVNPQLGLVLFGAFLLFVNVGCTFEFFRMVKTQGARPSRVLGYIFSLTAMLLVIAIPLVDNPLLGFGLVFGSFALFPMCFALSAIVQLWKQSDQPFRDAAYTMVPLLYIGLPLSLMLALVPDAGARVVLMLVLMVWLNDSGAYIGGSLFGKHKMWERHSPGKTWEGTAFGVLVTVLVAVFVGPWIQPAVAWYHWLALGLICSVIDTLGDLVESMLKRSVGMKDSGNIMPGHGGFLDRFDSLLIIMPFAFAYINLIIF
ncbi:MAG: phosphatidate cytidylyltransferase [Bacteroidales bacterium]|nr:phosphatidate cytidylyltransferase [Bacteroidales bacterium]